MIDDPDGESHLPLAPPSLTPSDTAVIIGHKSKPMEVQSVNGTSNIVSATSGKKKTAPASKAKT